MGFYNNKHDGERNLIAEQRILYGFLGAIPATLVCWPFGGIISIAIGFYAAYRAVADPIKRKEAYEREAKRQLEEMLTAKDEWDKISGIELNKKLNDDWDSQNYEKYEKVITLCHKSHVLPQRPFTYRYKDNETMKGRPFKDEISGSTFIIVEMGIREFFRRYYEDLKNGKLKKVCFGSVRENDYYNMYRYPDSNILIRPEFFNIVAPDGKPL